MQSAKVHCNQSTPKLTSTTQPRILRRNALVPLRLRCVGMSKTFFKRRNARCLNRSAFLSLPLVRDTLRTIPGPNMCGWAVPLCRFRDSIRASLSPTVLRGVLPVEYSWVARTSLTHPGHQRPTFPKFETLPQRLRVLGRWFGYRTLWKPIWDPIQDLRPGGWRQSINTIVRD